MRQDVMSAGSSVPSGYSGSALASIPVLSSLPSHAIDATKPALGEAALLASQASLSLATNRDLLRLRHPIIHHRGTKYSCTCLLSWPDLNGKVTVATKQAKLTSLAFPYHVRALALYLATANDPAAAASLHVAQPPDVCLKLGSPAVAQTLQASEQPAKFI